MKRKNKVKIVVFKIICVLMVSMIVIIVLAGCAKTPAVRSNCVEIHSGLMDVGEGDCALVKNRNELLAFVEVMSVDLDELAKYDDKFFQSNSLVIFNIIERHKDTENEIVTYAIENGTITINMETTKQGSDDNPAGYHWFVELNAKEASEITDIVIMKNGEKLQGKVAHVLERLYTLHEALKLSWMTLDDIGQIAKYRNSSTLPKEQLNDATALEIKEAKLSELELGIWRINECWPEVELSTDDVAIIGYYGEYNGCYAVELCVVGYDSVGGMDHSDNFDEGISIYYGFGPSILVWHE